MLVLSSGVQRWNFEALYIWRGLLEMCHVRC